MLTARQRDLVPDTIRFLQFSPPAVLVGYHQAVANEVRIEYCRESGIDVQRRLTGGGAIYVDTSQLGWEIIAKFGTSGLNRFSDGFSAKICQGVILGLRRLGLEARFRPRNDIEVHGRKISGTGGTEQGDAFLFQGTLLVDFDPETMVRSLMIPVEKLRAHEVDSIKDRVTWLSRELGKAPSLGAIKSALTHGFEKALDIKLNRSCLSHDERALLSRKRADFANPSWLNRIRLPQPGTAYIISEKKKKGIIKMLLGVDPRSQTIQYVHFLGDFFSTPREFVGGLEAALKFQPFDLAPLRLIIDDFYRRFNGGVVGFRPSDLIRLLGEAKRKFRLGRLGFNIEDTNRLHPVHGTYDSILGKEIRHLLLPYCAKGVKCGLRRRQGCRECLGCSTGEAQALVRKYGIRPITITSFEHLMKTLKTIRKADGFIGLCCEQFYIRHKQDFEKYRIPGLLINIENKTCFDLDEAREARDGLFQRQTYLPIDLLGKVLKLSHEH